MILLPRFIDADHVIVTEVYAAREAAPEDGFSAQQVVAAMCYPDVHFIPDLFDATALLLPICSQVMCCWCFPPETRIRSVPR